MRIRKIALVAVAAAFVGWVFYSLMHVEPVRVVESNLRHEDGQVFVEGKLENTGADVGPIDLEIHYYDNTGRALGQDKVVIDGLKGGAAARFRTPVRTLDGVSEFSIYLNHGRNPYGN
ncbi:MAG: FxLYD domain-containing protein [Candidatus Binataceae bacterium]